MQRSLEKYCKEKGCDIEGVEFYTDVSTGEEHHWVCEYRGNKFNAIYNKDGKSVGVAS